MLIESLLPYLSFHVKLCHKFLSSPYQWGNEESPLKQNMSRICAGFLKLQGASIVAYTVLKIVTLVTRIDLLSFPDTVTSFSMTVGLITFGTLRFNFQTFRIEMMQLVNGMRTYELSMFSRKVEI